MNRVLASAVLVAFLAASAATPVQADGGAVTAAIELENAFTKVAEGAFPSVVVITNKRAPSYRGPQDMPPEFYRFFGIPLPDPNERDVPGSEPQPAGRGSGVLIREDGYIITNYHVVADADELVVKLHDGRVFDNGKDEDAVTVVGTDPDTDLAVLRVGNGEVRGLPPVKFADSEKLRVGAWAIAVGAPFNLDYSVTVGVVSQKGRYNMRMNTYENYIQTDASINPGNSGGPLLNIRGELIGINDFIVTGGGMSRGNVGVGFAIPSNMVKRIAADLIANKRVIRPWLGISMQPLNDELKDQFGVDKGVLINEVIEGDPADKAGLQAGDVIVSVGDRDVDSPHDVQLAVLEYKPGEEVDVEVIRDGKKKTVGVVPRQRDGATVTEAAGGDEDDGDADVLAEAGLSLSERDGQVVVTDVERRSPAANAELRPGDIILSVDLKNVETIAQVRKRIAAKREKGVALHIQRGRNKMFVALRFGD